MSDNTGIEYADSTLPVNTGCDHVSPGCDNCFAATLTSGRLRHLPAYQGLAEHGRFNGQVRLLPERLSWALHWRAPRRIFISDMADLLHAKVPDSHVARTFVLAALTPRHTYMFPTKRHGRLRSLLNDHRRWSAALTEALDWVVANADGPLPAGDVDAAYRWIATRELATDPVAPLPNMWIGVSAENQEWADIRIPALLDTPAAVRWVSAEPLIGPVDLSAYLATGGLHWVVTGGESGKGARAPHPNWFRSLRDQCAAAQTAFWFKQWGVFAPAGPVFESGENTADFDPDMVEVQGTGCAVEPDGSQPVHWTSRSVQIDATPSLNAWWMSKVGKKAAGHELDGQVWQQLPEPRRENLLESRTTLAAAGSAR
jgi:protein gp37